MVGYISMHKILKEEEEEEEIMSRGCTLDRMVKVTPLLHPTCPSYLVSSATFRVTDTWVQKRRMRPCATTMTTVTSLNLLS